MRTDHLVKALPAPLRAWLAPAPDSATAATLRAGGSPWTDGIHLLWSAWLFITPAMGGGDYDVRWMLLTLASYPVFLLLYAKTLVSPARRCWRYPVGMILLCLLLLRWYPSGLSYFVFGCVMLGLARNDSLARYLLVVVGFNILLGAIAQWIGYPWQVLAWMLPMTLIIGVIIQVEKGAKAKEAALKLSQEEVRKLAASAERERIGRDLHDLLGHTLSLITLKLELARKLSALDPVASRREMEDAERVARKALAEVRSAVTGIRSATLAGELASARLMLEASMVHLDYDPPPALPADVEAALALLLREAATNIARHARAHSASVRFKRDGEVQELRIEDDGRGGVASEGNGIDGMRDRVRAMGGSLSIDSPKGRGTRLLARVPVPLPLAAMDAPMPQEAGA